MEEETKQQAIHDAEPQIIMDATLTKESPKTNDEEKAIQALRDIVENAGQMSELEAEEENLIKEFFDSLVKILMPFSKILEISVSSLPLNCREGANRAYLHITGQLVLIDKNGQLKILNLKDKENRQILIKISSEIMVKLKAIINSCKSETENRVKFLSVITRELQKVARVFEKK